MRLAEELLDRLQRACPEGALQLAHRRVVLAGLGFRGLGRPVIERAGVLQLVAALGFGPPCSTR
jgi:hypothetical protein